MTIRTALDGVTTLRNPETKIVTAPAEVAPKTTSSGPTVAAAGQGQTKAYNPLENLPSQAEYEATQTANEAVRTAAAASQGASSSGPAASLVETAKKYIGTPYVWGASSPLGFDCSGFTQYIFKQFGVNLPRHSTQQGQGGVAVSYADAKAGDLIYWDHPGTVDHVGIYLGNGMLISAPAPGQKVKIQAVYGKPTFHRYL